MRMMLEIKFPRMKLSNTAFIMMHIPVLLSILHSSSFCYLLIEENTGFAVKLGKQERPGSVDGRLKPELLLFWALGCDGILAPALQKKKFHNLISSPRLLMPSQMTSEIQAGFLVSLWDQQSCEEVLQDGMCRRHKWWMSKRGKAFRVGQKQTDILKSKFQVKCWSLLHRVQCKVKSENVKSKRRILLVKTAWDSWQDLMSFVSLIIS